MKKFLSLLLASALVISSFTACNRNKPEPEKIPESAPEPTYVYQNGEYSVQYSFPALDRTLDFLTISVNNDVIEIKDYGMKEAQDQSTASSDASGASSSSTQSASASEAASSTGLTDAEALAAKNADEILNEYEDAGQDVEQMKAVKDAEEHTYRFMRMMRTALEAAKSGDTAAVTLGKYADGSYKSIMPDVNADGWKEYIRLTVKDGQISEIEYNAMKGDDTAALITADKALNMGDDKPSVYYPQTAKNFTEAGDDLTKMLAPSGGGKATKTFGKLMRPLLISMISGGNTNITASRFMDGEYKAQFKDFDKFGWKEYVVLDIQNGVVTIKEFDAVSKDDEKKLKSEDDAASASMNEKTGTSFFKAGSDLIESWKQAKNDVTKVDNVAGATVASNSFKLLVGQILATTAVEGDNQKPLEVERLPIK
ncbi:hypothetical protein V6615_02225 [Oscillospiraceae bacterium PP1C4]